MKAGGWWEPPRTNVKRTVGIEFVTAILKRLPMQAIVALGPHSAGQSYCGTADFTTL